MLRASINSNVVGLALLAAMLCAATDVRANEVESVIVVDGIPKLIHSPVDVRLDDARQELVGLFVNGQESEFVLAHRLEEMFLLPADVLQKIGVTAVKEADALFLDTPSGRVKASLEHFRLINGETFFFQALLEKDLAIDMRFRQDKYAIDLILPWWEGLRERSSVRVEPKAEFEPPSFGLNQVRLDHTRQFNDDDSFEFTELLLRGRLAGGSWRTEIIDDVGRDVRAEDYYWLKDLNHFQALVGNQDVQINPLLPTVESTGVQGLYNSDAVEFDAYEDQTRNQYIRRLGIPVKEIEGVGQPGAIAELRVNGRTVARIRVKLDGTYAFNRVPLPSLQFASVEVHILDQRSLIALDVQDFTQTPIDLLLSGGQTVAFAGLGVHGNPLDPNRDVGDEAVFGLWRHGVSDRVTVEAGLQSASGVQHQVVGISASLWQRWATGISVGNRGGNLGVAADLFGRGQRWQMTLRSQNFEDEFRGEGRERIFRHDLRYEYRLTPRFSLGAYGRSVRSNDRNEEYLLPGLAWVFGARNSLRVWPDVDGDYRLDLRTFHRDQDWFEYIHDNSGDRAEYRYHQNEQLEFFARIDNEEFEEEDATTFEVGALWYPRDYDDRSSLRASVLSTEGDFGYRLDWQTPILPGLFSYLEVRDVPVQTDVFDGGLQVRWTVSLDFSFAGGRPIPGRADFTHSRAGSIGGKLTLANGQSVRSQGIDRVSVMVNGVARTALVNGNHFFLENVLPGTHQVSLSSEFLPMHLTPKVATHWVKVVPSATTKVSFELRQEFGISGRVTQPYDRGVANAAIEVLDSENKLVNATMTDRYGYYRLSGLIPGVYAVRVAIADGRKAQRTVTIEAAYLFDQDFTVPIDSDSVFK